MPKSANSTGKKFPPLWSNPTPEEGAVMNGCGRCHGLKDALAKLTGVELPDACSSCHETDPTDQVKHEK